MLENYLDVMGAARLLRVHQETVKRLIREGRIPAFKWGNKWIIERNTLTGFANTYDRAHGRNGSGPVAPN
jgi:excisionase family DNA binding protein